MKRVTVVIVLLLLTACAADKKLNSKSQFLPLMFKDGAVRFNVDTPTIADSNTRAIIKDMSDTSIRHMLLQFQTLPSEAKKNTLEENGISLLNYMPQNAYWVRVNQTGVEFIKTELINSDGKSGHILWSPPKRYKLSKQIKEDNYPDHAIEGSDVKLQIILYKEASQMEVSRTLNQKLSVSNIRWIDKHLMQIQTNRDTITALTEIDAIKRIEIIPPEIRVNVITVQADQMNDYSPLPFSLPLSM